MAQLPLQGVAPPAPLYALTVWDPWLWAIVDLPPAPWAKDVENRPWPLPQRLLGQWVALHAGLRWDPRGPAAIRDTVLHLGGTAELLPSPDALRADCAVRRGHVVALARFTRVLPPRAGLQAGWHWPAEYGWVVGQVHPLAQPVPARGYQRLWRLREPQRSQVVAQLPRALRAEIGASP